MNGTGQVNLVFLSFGALLAWVFGRNLFVGLLAWKVFVVLLHAAVK